MNNTISMTVIYGIIVLMTLLLVIGYWKTIQKKEKWLSCLYISVLAVNTGYFVLSMSKTLPGALWANRLVCLVSVFLPLTVFMLIMNVCQLQYKREYVLIHIILGIAVFCLDASGGYGPLHLVYGAYLLFYFAAMMGVVLYTMKKRKNVPYKVAVFLLIIVLWNMMVWMIEQLIYTEFEFLTVTYTCSGGVLFILYMLLEELSVKEQQECDKQINSEGMSGCLENNSIENMNCSDQHSISEEKKELIDCVLQKMNNSTLDGLENLSAREIEVLLLILDNKKRKSIAEEMEITENTVKKHTTHIFSKLGITSRKELFEKCNNNTSHQ